MKNPSIKNNYPQNFRIVNNIKSDISFEGYGKDLNTLFSSCALALSSITCDINMVPKIKCVKFEMFGKPEILLYDFLSKILLLIDTKEMFFSDFTLKIEEKNYPSQNNIQNNILENEYKLFCECFGSNINKKASKVHIKAITLHNLKITLTNSRYIAQVCVDV